MQTERYTLSERPSFKERSKMSTVNTTPDVEQALGQLVSSVKHTKWNLASVEKFLMYALGLVCLIDPSGVVGNTLREVGLGSSAGVLAAMHLKK